MLAGTEGEDSFMVPPPPSHGQLNTSENIAIFWANFRKRIWNLVFNYRSSHEKWIFINNNFPVVSFIKPCTTLRMNWISGGSLSVRFLSFLGNFQQKYYQTSCIPVGCVPPVRWPYLTACSPGGVCSRGGVCSGGVCCGGVSGPGGCLVLGGCLVPGGGCVCSWGCVRYPPVNRITDACKNITLPQLRCGR